jgi:hypothetical protein
MAAKADLMIFLKGTEETDHPLRILDGQRDVLEMICQEVDHLYKKHIIHDEKSSFLEICDTVTFPPFRGINVNMMPIKLYYLKETLPEEMSGYAEMIRRCFVPYCTIADNGEMSRNLNKVAYLTIHESYVEPGTTQRRPGLHIERPTVAQEGTTVAQVGPTVAASAKVYTRPSKERYSVINRYAMNRQEPTPEEADYMSLAWGCGDCRENIPVNGIYMASNVGGSCAVYPVLIEKPEGVAGAHGDIECMRGRLPAPTMTKANTIYWITDRTPHEALPMPGGGHRQFFRLVVGPVDVWYAGHNTWNPLCDPDATICHDNKFDV